MQKGELRFGQDGYKGISPSQARNYSKWSKLALSMFTYLLTIPQVFHDSQFMVLTSSRKIVAFLKARYPAPKFVDPDRAGIPFPEGSNIELFNHCFENMDIFEDKHMDYEKDYCESFVASRTSNLLDALSLESAKYSGDFSYDGKANAIFHSCSRHRHTPRIPPKRIGKSPPNSIH
jgi:hypothetical protein